VVRNAICIRLRSQRVVSRQKSLVHRALFKAHVLVARGTVFTVDVHPQWGPPFTRLATIVTLILNLPFSDNAQRLLFATVICDSSADKSAIKFLFVHCPHVLSVGLLDGVSHTPILWLPGKNGEETCFRPVGSSTLTATTCSDSTLPVTSILYSACTSSVVHFLSYGAGDFAL
jgi:hypothetical protein